MGFLAFVFLKRHWGGKGERWRGALAPQARGASPSVWVGKAASSPFPSPAPFLGSGPTGQPPPRFPDRKERQTGCNHRERLRFQPAVPVPLAVLFSFRQSQRPKCVFFDHCLRSSAVIRHHMTGVCFLPSPCYHGPATCPATTTLSLHLLLQLADKNATNRNPKTKQIKTFLDTAEN